MSCIRDAVATYLVSEEETYEEKAPFYRTRLHRL